MIIKIEKFHITTNSSSIYSETNPSIAAIPPIVVSSGGTVVLSAGTGASYLSSIKPKYLTLKVGAVYKF